MSQSEVVPRELTQQRLNKGYALIGGYRRDQAYSVADMLEERAADAAELPFVIFEGRSLSFAELNQGANRIAHAALAMGLQRGDVVALMMDNFPEFPMVWLGLAKIGIDRLLNTSARGRVLKHALGQTARARWSMALNVPSAWHRSPRRTCRRWCSSSCSRRPRRPRRRCQAAVR